jgi:hypothetical protein
MPKTYTRRKPNERIMGKLDELRGLIERHCGDTEQVVREAVMESMAALSPQIQMPMAVPNEMPMAVPNAVVAVAKKAAPCPGGPKVWNEFQKTFKLTNPRMEGETYKDYQVRMKEAYKAAACVLPRKTLKSKKAAEPVVLKTLGIRNVYPNVDPRFQTIKAHTQGAVSELDTLAANYPNLKNNINALRAKATLQQKRVNSMERQLNDQFENTEREHQETMYRKVLNGMNTRKQKLNTGLQTLRAKINTLRPKQQVRVMAPNNAFPVIPGENSFVPSASPSLNNALQAQPPLSQKQNLFLNNGLQGASSAVTTPNKSLLLQPVQGQNQNNSFKGKSLLLQPAEGQNNLNSPSANGKPTMIFNGALNENSGFRPVNINGKKYFYRESNNRLVERTNNDDQGNVRGYYNQTYPGLFRPNNE